MSIVCPQCGEAQQGDAPVCQCGAALPQAALGNTIPPPPIPLTPVAPPQISPQALFGDTGAFPEQVEYAGFWRRLLAALLDVLLCIIANNVVAFIIGVVVGAIGAVRGVTPAEMKTLTMAIALPINLVMDWLYFALMESSARHATLGKIICHCQVVDLHGKRISFAQATGRHFGKLISFAILCIGFILVAVNEKSQGLHDMMAGCLVVRINDGR